MKPIVEQQDNGLPHTARNLLIVLVAVIYSGLLPYLQVASPYLLDIFYVALCMGMVLYALPTRSLHQFLPVAPYLAWLAFFCMWGTLVYADPQAVLPYAARILFKNFLFISAVAVALRDSQDLRKLAALFQWGAIINCAVSVLEIANPDVVYQLASLLSHSEEAINMQRLSGLWGNANGAAFAFTYALLLSSWTRGILAWLGRAASVIGIYLTASRTGVYLLIIGGLVYIGLNLRSRRSRGGLRGSLIAWSAALLVLSWLFVGDLIMSQQEELLQNWTVKRLLDFREEETLPSEGLSRLQIAGLGLQRVLERPWSGYGLFTFQGRLDNSPGTDILPVTVHNIYLTVAGETGIIGFVTYLSVIGLGLKRLAQMGGSQLERMTGTLMWVFYLLIGLVWHNQLTSAAGMVYIGLLFSLPAALPAGVMSSEALEAPRRQIEFARKRL